jgi:hypothetical protein
MALMKNENELDELLYKACQDNNEYLKQYGPDFSKIEEGVRLRHKYKMRKKAFIPVVRVAIAAAAIIVVVNGILIFADFEPVKAYQNEIKKLYFSVFNDPANMKTEAEIIKSTNEIEKAQKSVPFTIPVPGWIPEGYTFNNVTLTEDGEHVTIVKLKYSSSTENLLISISSDSAISGTDPSFGERNFEVVKINGADVYIATANRDNGDRIKCSYYNNQGLNIYMSGSIDKQSLIRFVQSMK